MSKIPRILITTDAVKFSKPGNNVLTANGNELSFSSEASALALLLSGSITCNYSNPSNTTTTYTTVNFPTTYSGKPFAIAYFVYSTYAMRGRQYASGSEFISDTIFLVYPDKIQFSQSVSSGAGDVVAHYWVYDYMM